MTELIYNNTNSLLEEMYRQQDNPPSGDPVIAAMSEALPLAMEELPRFDGTVTRYIKKLSLQNSEEASSGVPVSEAYGKLRAALQYMATMYEREVVHQHPFPHGYHRPQRWRYLFERIDQDPAAQSLTETILNHLPVNTTTKDRYGPLEIGRQLFASAFGLPRVDWIDYGSSVRVGANAVHLKERYPFNPVTVLKKSGRIDSDGSELLQPDDALSRGYNALQHAPAVPGETLCIDAWPAREKRIRDLALTALRPVSEISNPDFMQEFRRLMVAEVPGVHFAEGNITHHEEIRAAKNRVPTLRPKVAFMGTVANQLGQEVLRSTLDAMLKELDDNGDLYVLDFASVDPKDPSAIRLSNTWSEWEYRLLRIGKDDPNTVHHLFSYRTSRPREAMVGPGLAKGPGGLLPMSEHLLQAAERTTRG